MGIINPTDLAINPALHEIVIEQLRTIKNVNDEKIKHFEAIVGQERIKQYRDNGFNLQSAYKYFNGSLEDNKINSVEKCLKGYEFNLYVVDLLRRKGVEDIKTEVKLPNRSKVDVLANLNGDEYFSIILPDMNERLDTLPIGMNAFEAKACAKLDSEVLNQISRVRKYYKNIHIVVLTDTRVPDNINDTVNFEGGKIIRAIMTDKVLLNRIEWIKSNFNKLM